MVYVIIEFHWDLDNVCFSFPICFSVRTADANKMVMVMYLYTARIPIRFMAVDNSIIGIGRG